MPQMVIPDYAPQIVWLVITFLTLYVVMAKVALPRVERVLQERRKRIDANLERAAALKEEADAAIHAYEEALRQAREAAHAALREAAQELAAEAVKRTASFEAILAEKAKAAEKRIAESKAQALAATREVAVEAAADVAAKLIGMEVPKDRASLAVDAVLKGGA